jgi:hypothetical protein
MECHAMLSGRNSLTVLKSITGFVFRGKEEADQDTSKKRQQVEHW